MTVVGGGFSGVMEPSIVWLDEPRAADTRLSGAKASNLALARQHGLPVIDGFVLTAPATAARWNGSGPGGPALRDAWAALSREGTQPLAVRSSSIVEDTSESSMAGQFRTVLHVRGWEPFVAAVLDVIDSAGAVGDVSGAAAMAVLVQPMADARMGGVLFGVDPLTGDRSHYLVAAVCGLPDQIVSGQVTGEQVRLGRHGGTRHGSARRGRPARRRRRDTVAADPTEADLMESGLMESGLLESGPTEAGTAWLGARERRELARLARAAERLFDAPQDIEWLVDGEGVLRLLQSRPITASALPPAGGHVLGASPVAETFPLPLSRLERDLWERPLEDGIREALRLSGAVSSRALGGRFVVDVGGRVAVDLEALGVVTPRRSWWRVLDPRPSARRLLASWRIGRLRVALPAIAHDLVAEVDGDLRSLAALERLGDVQLLTVISNAQRALAALHAHEVLSGFFVDTERATVTGASLALTTLTRARLDGLQDPDIIAAHPLVLSLVAPSVGGPRVLPPTPTHLPESPAPGAPVDAIGVAREALRLRVRWVQELTACAALELGARLEHRGQIDAALAVRDLDLRIVRHAIDHLDVVCSVPVDELAGPPLPDRFRLAVDGSVVPDVPDRGSGGQGGGVGVSAGRAVGTVTHDPLDAAGKVLVVRSLDPALASAVGVAAGLVAEHGSPLSHLAILAREFGVPAVAAMAGAATALHDGDRVLVDGAAGSVEVLERNGPQPAAHSVRPEGGGAV